MPFFAWLMFRLTSHWKQFRISGSSRIGNDLPVQAHPALDNSVVRSQSWDRRRGDRSTSDWTRQAQVCPLVWEWELQRPRAVCKAAQVPAGGDWTGSRNGGCAPSRAATHVAGIDVGTHRQSTRLNSSHLGISYA